MVVPPGIWMAIPPSGQIEPTWLMTMRGFATLCQNHEGDRNEYQQLSW